MTAAKRTTVRKVIGVCLLISCLLGLRTPLYLVFRLPEQPAGAVALSLLTIAGYGCCVAATIGLLTHRLYGYWTLYANTAIFLMIGASVPYIPLVLQVPERLRTGTLAFVNLGITLLVFWLHHRDRRDAAASTATRNKSG